MKSQYSPNVGRRSYHVSIMTKFLILEDPKACSIVKILYFMQYTVYTKLPQSVLLHIQVHMEKMTVRLLLLTWWTIQLKIFA